MKRAGATILAFVGLGVLAGVWGAFPLSHDDLFGHLHAGEWIVEHGAVPLTDPFSFTRGGTPWISHEWLFSVLTHAVHEVGGLPGLLVLRILLIVTLLLTAGALAWRVADPRGREPALLPLFLAAALVAGRPELILRAALVSSIFLLLTFLLLEIWDRRGRAWALVLLLGLFWVWGNLHSGVIFGLFAVGLYGAEALLLWAASRLGPVRGAAAAPRSPRGGVIGALALLLGCLAAALVNPHGVAALAYPFRLSAVLFGGDLALDLGHFVSGRPYAEPGLVALAVILAIGLLPPRRLLALPWRYGLALITFAALSWRTPRFYLETGLLAAVVAFLLWSDRSHEWIGSRGELAALGRRVAVTVVAALGLGLLALAGLEAVARPPGLIGPNLPVRAVDFVERNGPEGRLFHHQNWGAYLGWKLDRPIFWDGRNLVFAQLMRELAGQSFETTVGRYDLQGLLLAEKDQERLAGALDPAQWGLVYWDDRSALYARRSRANRDLLREHELRYFPAFGGRPGLAALAADPVAGEAALAELDRVLEANPETQRALYFRAVLSYYRGRIEAARRDLDRAESLGPNPRLDALRELLDGG